MIFFRIAACVLPLLSSAAALAGCPTRDTRGKGFEVVFDDDLRSRTTSILGPNVTYDILEGGNKVETITARYGFFTLKRETPARTIQYAYSGQIDQYFPFKPGQDFKLDTLMMVGQQSQKLGFQYSVDRSEELTFGKCRYRGLWIKAVSDIYTTTWFWIPDLYISAAMIIDKAGQSGQMTNIKTRKAISISQ